MREKGRKKVMRMRGGKNLCSLHECVANKSSFSMTNYYKKVKNEKILLANRRARSGTGSDELTMEWKEKEDGKSRSRVIFIEAKSLSKTLNQLNALGRVSNINLIFFLLHPTSARFKCKNTRDWKLFSGGFVSSSSVNCRTFFIIEWRNFLSQAGGENESILGLQMENRRKISFLLLFPNHCVLLFSDSIIWFSIVINCWRTSTPVSIWFDWKNYEKWNRFVSDEF